MRGTAYSRYSYVYEIVGQLESTHPQAVADMLAHAAPLFTIGPDGIARRVGDGSVVCVGSRSFLSRPFAIMFS